MSTENTAAAPSVVHSTFVLERNLSVSVERAFAAWADSQRKRRWFIDSHGNEIQAYESDFRPGGMESTRFRFKPGTPVAGLVCQNESVYLDIVPDQRIVFASRMIIGGHCISATLVSVEFLARETGTNLVLTHQGAFFEGSDGPERREGGWNKLMERLQEDLAQ